VTARRWPALAAAGFGQRFRMKKEQRPAKVVVYQSIGFLVIIAVCLLDELAGLSSLIFGNQSYIFDFRETIFKMLLVLGVWLLVAGSTRRLLSHMRYLEGFFKVCSWCRRVEYKGRWMPVEEFFRQGFDTPTSHGICRACLTKEKAALEKARQVNPAVVPEPAAAKNS